MTTGDKGAKVGHTAGPWQTVILDGDTYIQMGDGSRPNSGQALLARVQRQGEEQKANALLIASAPELLEACKWYQMACEDVDAGQSKGYFQKAMELGRVAIAKAEGRA